MAFKASFKFSDSREFDVLRWDVKFNRDVDPKGRPASDIYGGTINVEVESTPDTIVLDKMFKQYQPVNGNIAFTSNHFNLSYHSFKYITVTSLPMGKRNSDSLSNEIDEFLRSLLEGIVR